MIEHSFSSNFQFLEQEYPILANIAASAEYNCFADPVTALFKLRQFGEHITELLFDEHGMELPFENNFHNRLKALEFEKVLPERVKDLLFTIKNKGNIAVHASKGTVDDAKLVLFSAFKVAKWFCETYSVKSTDLSHIKFSDPKNLDTRYALKLLETSFAELNEKFLALQLERKPEGITKEKESLIREKSEKAARKIDMSEQETRELIDGYLRMAGWEVNTKELNYKINKTLPKKGKYMAIAEWPVGSKWADYALFIDKKLYGIVEAKKYAADISTDLRQSKIYAELAEAKYDAILLGEWCGLKAPFLFSTNGRPYLEQIKTKSGIWFLDTRLERNASKPLQGWYSPTGLIQLYEQEIQVATDKLIAGGYELLQSKAGLGLRDYQIKAIKAVENRLIQEPEINWALLAMATGTGKARTILGLCYRLIQTNRFKRILFLVDRTLLGTQASDTFKDNKIVGVNTFAEIYEVKGLKVLVPEMDTRVHFATVQGMVKRLFFNENGEGTPPIDQYDCIIIDEAHRGYLKDRELDEDELNFKDQRDYVSKYRMVLDYFDAFAVALTATPALHTTEIFGHPVFTYSYREAVVDGYLSDHEPPYLIKTKLSEEGIVWEAGEKPKAFDKEHNTIIELDTLEDELAIEISGFNKMVITESFNRTVIKELVKALDPEGDEKTLVFCATDEHADLVVHLMKEEFKAIGVDLPDDAIQKITGKSYDPVEQVKKYKNEKFPNIAVTVDLLTTGVDVPAICNLVFLRRVRSRILYEQMLGRATRRCDDINKEVFRIYDAVRIYEALQDFTQMNPVVANPKISFKELVLELDEIDNLDKAKKQIDQLIAKLQRKKKLFTKDDLEKFAFNAHGLKPDDYINDLNNSDTPTKIEQVKADNDLWNYLDEFKPTPNYQLVSEHTDELRDVARGYGNAQKPEDYLLNFTQFIKENLNEIAALNTVVNRPKDLTRKSLKELLLVLDSKGFDILTLRHAWKAAKNQDIAADIITYIRTMALGSSLLSHRERIGRAMEKVRNLHEWNATQKKWLDRFENQLLAETILQKEDLNSDPFSDSGGYDRLNKIFDNQLNNIINMLNENLYVETA
ncbi:MAG: type I restriction-modification system endonuclease [Salinivirgaceae bacterium]